MMDLLYGELPADERAALEAHVAGCARCRAELAAFQGTRAAPAARSTPTRRPRARTTPSCARPPRPSPTKQATAGRGAPRAGAAVVLGAAARALDAADVRHGRARSPSSCWRARSSSSPTRRSSSAARRFNRRPPRRPPAPPAAVEPRAAKEARGGEKSPTGPGEKKRQDEAPGEQPSVANNGPARSIGGATAAPRRRAAPGGFGALGSLTKGGGSDRLRKSLQR